MSIFGTVKTVNGKFKLNGDFHVQSPHMPIRNADKGWRLMGVTNPRCITHIHMYGGEAIFFENLSKKTIFGTRCDNPACPAAATIYLPFRIHCPDCLAKNTVVDLTDLCRDTATIHTFMVCERSGAFNTLEKPIRFINVAFAGVATILMSYLSVGTPDIGKRVIPIFRTTGATYTITDLSWAVEGTAVEMLPEGFSF
jgi:uncharacterized OB-fold protein